MKQRRKAHKGSVQGHALLYGRSSKAIRIVNGEVVGKVEHKHHPPKINRRTTIATSSEKQVQKKYRMDENTKRKLDRLQDPLDMINRSARAQKYEAVNSTEKYEYGLSDW